MPVELGVDQWRVPISGQWICAYVTIGTVIDSHTKYVKNLKYMHVIYECIIRICMSCL